MRATWRRWRRRLRLHPSWASFKARAPRQASTWGGLTLLAFGGWLFVGSSERELAEMEAKIRHIGPILLGVVGVYAVAMRGKDDSR